MDIFIYGDESGVFDKKHNDIFVFGGLIFLDKEQRDIENRKYIHAEKCIASNYRTAINKRPELKASALLSKHKEGLFRSTNGLIRYAFIVDQKKVLDSIFEEKKSKQRYLDYVYKIGIKRCFEKLIRNGDINPSDVGNIYVFFDEHSTATNGRYELQEGMQQEYKHGTFSTDFSYHFPPVFPHMKGGVSVQYSDSKKTALIRASDIIANHAWHFAKEGEFYKLEGKIIVIRFP